MSLPFSKFPTLRSCLVLAALVIAGQAWAQSPTYRPPPPPAKGTAVEVRLRYLLAPDIAFSGFGSVSLRDSYESSTNIFEGTERFVGYDDGFIGQDYTQATLIEGGLPNQEQIPSANKEASSFFAYNNESQVNAEDPTYLTFHRYASVGAEGEVLEGSSSGSMGWELNYTKFINRKRNLGIQVGFSFNGFDSSYHDSIDADLYVQEFKHKMADGVTVPDLPDPVTDADGNVTQQPPYVGDRVQEAGGTTDLLEWLASEESSEVIADGASVNAQADLRSSVYNFRAGPSYSLNMGKGFGLQLGAGVTAIYFSGSFSAYEILMNPGGSENPSRARTTTEAAEWQVAGYVDANAFYNLTERVDLFSGLQFQSGNNYNQQNDNRHASVEFDTQVYVHAGIGIKF